jgi:hypothetical protein
MIVEGFDVGAPVTKQQVGFMTGMKFAARYINGDWKRMTLEEAKMLTEAGLKIVSIYQTTANMALGTYIDGIDAANKAIVLAKQLNQPFGSAIYFAVDFNVTFNQYDLVEQFFKGLQAGLKGKYLVGIYGKYDVMVDAKKNKYADRFWQTYAWSANKVFEGYDMYQYSNSFSKNGFTIDLCKANIDTVGHWTTNPIKVIPPITVPVIPSTPVLWKEAAAKELITKYGLDPNYWKADMPMTFGELAAILLKGGK